VIFTLASSVFLVIPEISDSFWLLLDLSSQVSLVYYIILFAAAVRLRHKTPLADGYQMPGGKFGVWIAMGLGVFTSLIAFMAGFISPFGSDNPEQQFFFHFFMWVGLMIALFLPLVLLLTKKEITAERL
ncbi:MAG TPA: amino acid permease, partial [Coxiellaceae bacterium]|nr:amino acid permease [Coxiellaceae bacterium]